MKLIIPNLTEKVKLALALDKCSLRHSVAMSPDEALAFAEKGESYNNLERDKLYTMIEKINSIIPRMNYPACNGHENPNNGRTFHTFEIGNENSRVVYVNVINAYLKNHNQNLKVLADAIEQAGRDALADEVSTTVLNGSFQVRIWWD